MDEGVECVKDSKRLVKRLDDERQIDQQTEVSFEIYVERDRLSLERIRTQQIKGINVVDFRYFYT